MVAVFDLKNPPVRRIPKGRVSRQHHYVMKFPDDLKKGMYYRTLYGFAYINFFDSFLEDCHKRMYQYTPDQSDIQPSIFTACLN